MERHTEQRLQPWQGSQGEGVRKRRPDSSALPPKGSRPVTLLLFVCVCKVSSLANQENAIRKTALNWHWVWTLGPRFLVDLERM